MNGKLLLTILFLLPIGCPAYASNSQPVVAATFRCTGNPAVRSGPCPNGGRPGVILLGSDGNLYGTAQVSMEGTSAPNGGTVFSLTLTGTLKVLHTFLPGANKNYSNGNLPGLLTEGPDGKLYGETLYGGVNGCNGYCGNGVLYRVNTDGSGFQIIHKYCSQANCTDGAFGGALVAGADGNLYGSSFEGGTGNCGPYCQGCGTIFRVTPSSGAYQVVYNFPGSTDEFPSSLTPAPDGTFYGTDFGTNGIHLFHYTPATGAFQTVVLKFPNFNGLPSAPASSLTIGPNGNFYGLYHIYAHCCEGIFEVQPEGSNLKLFPTDNTLKGANGLILATDGNFWTLEYNGGTGYGEILTISPSNGTVIQTFSPFSASAPVGAYPAWLIQAKDGTFWGSTGQYGNQSKGHFADGTVYNLNLGLPLR